MVLFIIEVTGHNEIILRKKVFYEKNDTESIWLCRCYANG